MTCFWWAGVAAGWSGTRVPNRCTIWSKRPFRICPEDSASLCTCCTPSTYLQLLQAWKKFYTCHLSLSINPFINFLKTIKFVHGDVQQQPDPFPRCLDALSEHSCPLQSSRRGSHIFAQPTFHLHRNRKRNLAWYVLRSEYLQLILNVSFHTWVSCFLKRFLHVSSSSLNCCCSRKKLRLKICPICFLSRKGPMIVSSWREGKK